VACDLCFARGGGFKQGPAALRCDSNGNEARSAQYDDVGFRCCAD
jgi:formylglycine-generating enzyme required for sulfatase activity